MNGRDILPVQLRVLLKDKKSGSSDLLSRLNSVIIKNYSSLQPLKKIIPYLKKEFSSFGGIAGYLNKIEKIQDFASLKNFLNNFARSNEEKYDSIFNHIFPYLADCSNIVTISNSRTVIEILLRHKKKKRNLKVVTSESRPVNEGRVTARLLAANKIKVEFITEAMLPSFIERCDCALIGADMILKNGNIVNKTGSRLIAILCAEFRKPYYVAVDKSKLTKKNFYKPAKKPAGEVWLSDNKLINVSNFYFEEIEKKYITRIFTD